MVGSETGMWMQQPPRRHGSTGPGQSPAPIHGVPGSSGNVPDVQLPPNWGANLNEQQMQQMRSLYAAQQQSRAQLANGFNGGQPRPQQLPQGSVGQSSLPQVRNQNAQMPSGGTQSNPPMNQNQMLLAQQLSQMAAAQNKNQQQGMQQSQQQSNPVEQGTSQQPQPGSLPPNNGPPGVPNFAYRGSQEGMYQSISDAELITTGKTMIPKLNAQLRATEAQLSSCPIDSPLRPGSEAMLAKIHGFRNGLLKEMQRRGLDPKALGLPSSVLMGKTTPMQNSMGVRQPPPPPSQASPMQVQGPNMQGNQPPRSSPANRQVPLTNNNAQAGGPRPPQQPISQQNLQHLAMTALNVMTKLEANSSLIPRPTSFMGMHLQGQKPVQPPIFYAMFQSIAAKRPVDTNVQYVDGKAVEPYILFIVVCKFGGHAEVSPTCPCDWTVLIE